MATTIVTKNSTTAASVPSAGSLTQGELAVNVTDKRLFTKDSGGNVVEVGTNPTALAVAGNTTVGGTLGVTGNTTVSGTLGVTGAFSANGGATLGDASGDALTINSSAVSIPNGLNFGSNNLVLSSGNVGIGTSSVGERLTVRQDQNAQSRITLSNQDSGSSAESSLRLGCFGGSWDISNGSVAKNSNALTFSQVGSSERMRIDSSVLSLTGLQGIKFQATQSTSSDANTLDDYEEGTWTPTIYFGNTAATTSATGFYTKVGRIVTVTAHFSLTSKNGGTGSMTMENFPFFTIISATNANRGGAAIGYYNGFSGLHPYLMLTGNTAGATFRKGNGTDFNNTEVVDGSSCWFSYTYISN